MDKKNFIMRWYESNNRVMKWRVKNVEEEKGEVEDKYSVWM